MKIIVALCKNYGIGKNNSLPWNLKKDLLYFKNKTIGTGNNAIIMGKNTWNSLPLKPLPKRFNCVFTNSLNINESYAKSFKNSSSFDTFIENKKFDDIWIIGGESIYKKFIFHPNLDEIYVTKIDEYISCDTYFPDIPFYFSLVEKSSTYNENNLNYNFEVYKKSSTYFPNLEII